jgi:hypothetical protein
MTVSFASDLPGKPDRTVQELWQLSEMQKGRPMQAPFG